MTTSSSRLSQSSTLGSQGSGILTKSTVVTCDIETSGLDWQTGRIHLLGYRLNGEGDIFYEDPYSSDRHTDELNTYLSNPANILRGHGIKFDALFLARAGYDIRCQLEDTRVMAYVCWPEAPSHSLKDLVRSKLRGTPTDLSSILFKPLKKDLAYLTQDDYFEIDNQLVRKDLLRPYHTEDILNVDRLRALMTPPAWFFDVEMLLTKILFESELGGCPLDKSRLDMLQLELTSRCDAVMEKLGKDFNPNSPKQVVVQLEKMGYDLSKICGKTDGGAWSVDDASLKNLAFQGETFAVNLREYRRLSKLLGTYIEPLLTGCERDGRVHGSFNQAGSEDRDGGGAKGTVTGRLTSSNPNLQNIPSRTKDGKKIRSAFIASKGMYMFDTDLKQIEPRFVGHYTQSPKLIHAYNNNLDTHGLFACDIFRKETVEQLTTTERFVGKTSWLATFYGCWYRKLLSICERYSEERLVLDTGRFVGMFDLLPKVKNKAIWWEDSQEDLIKQYGEEKARDLYAKWMFFKDVQDTFIKKNPELWNWRTEHINRVRYCGYVKTFGGRIIRIHGLDHKMRGIRQEAERKAVNYQIQGSAADAIKMITVQFGKQIVLAGKGNLFANVHDEILGELKDPKDIELVKYIMENTFTLKNIPIAADTHLINNWSEK